MARTQFTAEDLQAQGACTRVDAFMKELNAAIDMANKSGVAVGIALKINEHGSLQLAASMRPARLGLDLGKWGTSK